MNALNSRIRIITCVLACLTVGLLRAETVTAVYSFGNGSDGAGPWGAPVEASDGNIYGTTAGAGTYGVGTVYRITKGGAFAAVYSFKTNGVDGQRPAAGLIQARDGYLYGTATGGGANSVGTIFRISTSGEMTTLHSFVPQTEGAFPQGGLVQAADGNPYGVTFGGVLNYGSVFRVTTSGQLTVLHTFTNGDDGGKPQKVTLLLARDGNLYGTTSQGGAYGKGTLFRIMTNGSFTTLYSFTNGIDGGLPQAGLTEGRDGYLYGTASVGGAYGFGSVYRISLNGAFTSIYSFTGGSDGRKPVSNFLEAGDGYFYGTADSGGTNKSGELFAVNANGAFKAVILTPLTGGNCAPGVGLSRASDGNVYGAGVSGGANLYGTVFRVSGIAPLTQPLVMQSPHFSGTSFSFEFPTVSGTTYVIESTTNPVSANWSAVSNVIGNGAIFRLSVPANKPGEFFRIRQ